MRIDYLVSLHSSPFARTAIILYLHSHHPLYVQRLSCIFTVITLCMCSERERDGGEREGLGRVEGGREGGRRGEGACKVN